LKSKLNQTEIESEVEDAAVISVGDEDSDFTNLAESLVEIKKLNGVLGVILRNKTSAVVAFDEQDKISGFALLSTCIREASVEMAKPFDLSYVESVLVKGKDAKVFCFRLGDNMLDVLMETSMPEYMITEQILL
jgi:predicted regulator of Ras-like GTPase activity (Roadblock/LC7/MglB family)